MEAVSCFVSNPKLGSMYRSILTSISSFCASKRMFCGFVCTSVWGLVAFLLGLPSFLSFHFCCCQSPSFASVRSVLSPYFLVVAFLCVFGVSRCSMRLLSSFWLFWICLPSEFWLSVLFSFTLASSDTFLLILSCSSLHCVCWSPVHLCALSFSFSFSVPFSSFLQFSLRSVHLYVSSSFSAFFNSDDLSLVVMHLHILMLLLLLFLLLRLIRFWNLQFAFYQLGLLLRISPSFSSFSFSLRVFFPYRFFPAPVSCFPILGLLLHPLVLTFYSLLCARFFFVFVPNSFGFTFLSTLKTSVKMLQL